MLQRSFKEIANIMHLPGVNQEISALNRALSSSEISNYLKCMELEEKKEIDGKAENKEGESSRKDFNWSMDIPHKRSSDQSPFWEKMI